jgi:hypothetical protein
MAAIDRLFSRLFLGCAMMCVLLAAPAAAQEGPKPKVPKKGDEIIVRGCLKGLILTATETSLSASEDSTGKLVTPYTYQLKGPKDLLRKLREEHDDRVVEVTGELKSTLPQESALRGVTIGKTRIMVGVGANSADPMVRQGESLPVLEVKSYEGVRVTCGG